MTKRKSRSKRYNSPNVQEFTNSERRDRVLERAKEFTVTNTAHLIIACLRKRFICISQTMIIVIVALLIKKYVNEKHNSNSGNLMFYVGFMSGLCREFKKWQEEILEAKKKHAEANLKLIKGLRSALKNDPLLESLEVSTVKCLTLLQMKKAELHEKEAIKPVVDHKQGSDGEPDFKERTDGSVSAQKNLRPPT